MPDQRPVLTLGHSPDPDDAFMWWPLVATDHDEPRVPSSRFQFELITDDIEALNERAEQGELDITAISCAHYPRVRNTYALTACGASLGDNYGPKLVSAQPMTLDDLRGTSRRIAVPGVRTSAFGALSLMLGRDSFAFSCVPFERIIEAVAGGEFAAGVVIHEGQLTYEQASLHLIADLGSWWHKRTSLPLPLGANVIRRSLDDRFAAGTMAGITGLLRQSVDYALANRDKSIAYALRYARDMGAADADRFIQMYVNNWTLDFGRTGSAALGQFLGDLHAAGLTSDPGEIDFIRGPSQPAAQPK